MNAFKIDSKIILLKIKEKEAELRILRTQYEEAFEKERLELKDWASKYIICRKISSTLKIKKGTIEYGGVHDSPMCSCAYVYKEDIYEDTYGIYFMGEDDLILIETTTTEYKDFYWMPKVRDFYLSKIKGE